MNEWKNLEVDNLPSDILTGDYEFEWDNKSGKSNIWCRCSWHAKSIIDDLYTTQTEVRKLSSKFRYRKPEPKQPTHIKHEDILEMLRLIGDSPAFPIKIRYAAFEIFSHISLEPIEPPEEK